MAGTGSSPSSGPGHFDNTLCQPRHQGQGPIARLRRMRLATGGDGGGAPVGVWQRMQLVAHPFIQPLALAACTSSPLLLRLPSRTRTNQCPLGAEMYLSARLVKRYISPGVMLWKTLLQAATSSVKSGRPIRAL